MTWGREVTWGAISVNAIPGCEVDSRVGGIGGAAQALHPHLTQAPILQMKELTSRKNDLPKGISGAIGRTETRIQTSGLEIQCSFHIANWWGEAQTRSFWTYHNFLSV